MMPALPRSASQAGSGNLIIIDSILSTIPARHRERYSSSLRKLSTITTAPCPRSNEIAVHDALESLSIISRNNQ
jgi:hypothetical protein